MQTTAEASERCRFCNRAIPDQAYGFILHAREAPECRELWRLWREFVHEDFGGA